MNKKKMTWGSLLLWGLMLVAAAGCSSQTQGPETAPDSKVQPPTATVKNNEPIELHLYSSSGQDLNWFETTYGKYLRPKFPHITFKVHFPSESKIQDYVATRQPLDIVFGAYTNFHTAVLDLNLQNDISDLIKRDNYNLSNIEPTVVELQRQLANGGIYGLPAFIGTSGLYYNKDIFDRFGVPYPKDDMTWDEIYELAVKLTRQDGGTAYYGIANDNSTYIQVNQLSLDLVDPKTFKTNFTSEPWKKLIQMMAKLMMIPGSDPAQATVTNFNTKGNVAMATNYTGCCGFTPGEAVPNWGVVRIPDLAEARNVGPQVFPNYWFMSSTSKYRDQAFEVMKFISSEEFQTSMNARGLATALNNSKLHEKYGLDLPKYAGRNLSILFPKKRAPMSNITAYQVLAASRLNAALNRHVKEGIDINTVLREAAEATDKEIETAREAKK